MGRDGLAFAYMSEDQHGGLGAFSFMIESVSYRRFVGGDHLPVEDDQGGMNSLCQFQPCVGVSRVKDLNSPWLEDSA